MASTSKYFIGLLFASLLACEQAPVKVDTGGGAQPGPRPTEVPSKPDIGDGADHTLSHFFCIAGRSSTNVATFAENISARVFPRSVLLKEQNQPLLLRADELSIQSYSNLKAQLAFVAEKNATGFDGSDPSREVNSPRQLFLAEIDFKLRVFNLSAEYHLPSSLNIDVGSDFARLKSYSLPLGHYAVSPDKSKLIAAGTSERFAIYAHPSAEKLLEIPSSKSLTNPKWLSDNRLAFLVGGNIGLGLVVYDYVQNQLVELLRISGRTNIDILDFLAVPSGLVYLQASNNGEKLELMHWSPNGEFRLLQSFAKTQDENYFYKLTLEAESINIFSRQGSALKHRSLNIKLIDGAARSGMPMEEKTYDISKLSNHKIEQVFLSGNIVYLLILHRTNGGTDQQKIVRLLDQGKYSFVSRSECYSPVMIKEGSL